MSAIVKCDGCGTAEPVRTKQAIETVELHRIFDTRVPAEIHRADLCEQCQGHLLFEYFNVKPDHKLSVPAFLGPTSSERAAS